MRLALLIALLVDGLVHLKGFTSEVAPGPDNEAERYGGPPFQAKWGVVWLLAAGAFLTAAGLYLVQQPSWWLVAGVALLISQVSVGWHWAATKFVTILNAFVLYGTMALG